MQFKTDESHQRRLRRLVVPVDLILSTMQPNLPPDASWCGLTVGPGDQDTSVILYFTSSEYLPLGIETPPEVPHG